ncbi:very long chain fatty acid elongase 7-like isoform X1 [Parasteatoda tepidariorum]|uniref:very long chain fatty acid elongase 7-like isoform X1 n=2 Tax=Parasteatoda tepidariorum TaxID=114398 RepID=UPI001C71B243|nr:elongation of very long chain fatty acids protein 7-like isoform X1 [Parasteatoda tepidariorum]
MTQHGILNRSDFGRLSVMDFLQRIDDTLEKTFDSGDKEIRTWFLVRQNTLPFVLCCSYALFCTVIGPAMMKNRKPFNLRMPMILFNAFLVVAYSISLFTILFNLPQVSYSDFCKGSAVKKGTLTYKLTSCCWVLYILKYIEFIDTIFFILRKKMNSVTFLHVVHHTVVPILGWIMLRTETSGFQSIPVMINGFVHIIMYAYYGLSAIGPKMRPYLWWKKYLTVFQMVKSDISFFVFITYRSTTINVTQIILPLSLFENFNKM